MICDAIDKICFVYTTGKCTLFNPPAQAIIQKHTKSKYFLFVYNQISTHRQHQAIGSPGLSIP